MNQQSPGTPQLLRAINDRAALKALLEHGPLTRPELGDLTGLSKPTASQLLTRLRETGLVILEGRRGGNLGRTAEEYGINPSSAHVCAMRSSFHSATTIRAPPLPRCNAMPFPMPFPDPVMITTLPSTVCIAPASVFSVMADMRVTLKGSYPHVP